MEHKINPKNLENIAKIFIALIVLHLAIKGVYQSINYSTVRFSEANALRAGEGFSKNGFLSNAGLPDVCYGNQFPNTGLTWKRFQIKILHMKGLGITEVPPNFDPGPKDKCVYKGYPPGPDWLAGLLTKICGVGNLSCFRLFPTIIAIFSVLLFALMLISALGPVKSAITMLAIAIIPMTRNMMPTLHFHSYAFSLLLIELGFLLNIFKKKLRLNIPYLFILFLLGFLQGWLSFDHFFLVCLSPLPFALLYSPLHQKEDIKQFLYAILTLSTGFSSASFLHFIQIWIYDGSVMAAYKYISLSANWRFDDSGGGIDFLKSRIILVLQYLSFYEEGVHFKRPFLPAFSTLLLWIVFVLIWVKNATLIIHKPLQIVLKWTSSIHNFYVILTAFLVSFLWIIIMKQHANIHIDEIIRHLFLLYFFCILTILECVSADNFNNLEA